MQKETQNSGTYQWIPVAFKCGHTDTVSLYGNATEIALQAAGMTKKSECPQCAFKRFGEWPQPSFADAVQFARHWKINLPMLTGNEQDVRQATIIRGHACLMPWPLLRHIFMQEAYALGEIPYYTQILKYLFADESRFPDKYLYRGYINEMAKMPPDALKCWLDFEAHTVRELVNMSLRYSLDKGFSELKNTYDQLVKEEPNVPSEVLFEKAKQIVYDKVLNSMSPEVRQDWEAQSQPKPHSNRKHAKSKKKRKK